MWWDAESIRRSVDGALARKLMGVVASCPPKLFTPQLEVAIKFIGHEYTGCGEIEYLVASYPLPTPYQYQYEPQLRQIVLDADYSFEWYGKTEIVLAIMANLEPILGVF